VEDKAAASDPVQGKQRLLPDAGLLLNPSAAEGFYYAFLGQEHMGKYCKLYILPKYTKIHGPVLYHPAGIRLYPVSYKFLGTGTAAE
jgi:hypothetical protein